jgi:hypothetical protein
MNRKDKSNHWKGQLKQTNKQSSRNGERIWEEDEEELHKFEYHYKRNGHNHGRHIKSTHKSTINPLDDLDNLTADELQSLKRKTPFLNKDLMSTTDVDRLKAQFGAQFETLIVKERDGKEQDVIEKNKALLCLMKEFSKPKETIRQRSSSNRTIQQAIYVDIKQSDQRKISQLSVFSNIDMLMSPLSYKIETKQYVEYQTPLQQFLNSEKEKEENYSLKEGHHQHKRQTLITTTSEHLQEYIICSCFNPNFITLTEVIYLIELHRDAFLKKVIFSRKDLTFICVFEWDEEPFFVFLISFKATSNVFIELYDKYQDEKAMGDDILPNILHLSRDDVVNRQDNDDYAFVHRYRKEHFTNTVKILECGKPISEDLLDKLTFSTISYMNYGYALSSNYYLF